MQTLSIASPLLNTMEDTTGLVPWIVAIGAASILSLLLMRKNWLWRSTHPIDAPTDVGLRVVVIGAGAIGATTGLRLLPAVQSVTLVGRASLRRALDQSPDHILRLLLPTQTKEYRVGQQGLDVCFIDEEDWSMHSCWKDCDVVLLATKSVSTPEVGKSLASLPHPPKLIISLQNGIRNGAILREYFPPDSGTVVLTTVVAWAAEWVPTTESCTYRCTVPGKTYVEEPAHDLAVRSSAFRQLVRALNSVSIPTRVVASRRMQTIAKTKLLINAAINPINALAGVSVPAMMSDPNYLRIIGALVLEGSTVLWPDHRLLLRLTLPLFTHIFVHLIPSGIFLRVLPPTYKSSMLQDIERGRNVTEVHDFNGEIVRLSEGHQDIAPALLHQRVVMLIEELVQSRRHVRDAEDLLLRLGLTIR